MSLLAAKLASPRIRASTYHTDRKPRLCGHRRSWVDTARRRPVVPAAAPPAASTVCQLEATRSAMARLCSDRHLHTRSYQGLVSPAEAKQQHGDTHVQQNGPG